MVSSEISETTPTVSVPVKGPDLREVLAKSDGAVSGPDIREDHVSNAVSFLKNPKVLASGAGAKREFLRSKGLTEEEIDEAFLRAAQEPASVASISAAPPAVKALAPSHLPLSSASLSPISEQASWARNVAAAGVLIFAAYGVGSLVSPLIRSAWRWWRSEAEEDVQSQLLKLLTTYTTRQDNTTDQVKELATSVQHIAEQSGSRGPSSDQQAYMDALRLEVARLNDSLAEATAAMRDVSEIRSMLTPAAGHSSHEVSSGPRAASSVHQVSVRTHPSPDRAAADRAALLSAGRGAASQSASWTLSDNSPSPASFPGPAQGMPRPAASTQALSGYQHGLTGLSPPGIVSGHASSSTPAAGHGSSAQVARQQLDVLAPSSGAASGVPHGGGTGGVGGGSAMSDASYQSEPQKPADYLQVLQMLEKGETPPGIRTDIRDMPPWPQMSASPATVPRRPKPWEGAAGAPTELFSALGSPSHSPAFWASATQESPARYATPAGSMPNALQASSQAAVNGSAAAITATAQGGSASVTANMLDDVDSDGPTSGSVNMPDSSSKRNFADGPASRALYDQPAVDSSP